MFLVKPIQYSKGFLFQVGYLSNKSTYEKKKTKKQIEAQKTSYPDHGLGKKFQTIGAKNVKDITNEKMLLL